MTSVVTSVVTALNGHVGYIVMAVCTHALVGYTFGTALFDEPKAGLLGGVVADVDLLFPAAWSAPFVHRGITHTALAGGVAVAIAWQRNRRTAGAVGIGYTSQLVIDATTPKGILLAYPVSTESVVVPLSGHSRPVTLILWTVCLGVLWRCRNANEADEEADTESDYRRSLRATVKGQIRRVKRLLS